MYVNKNIQSLPSSNGFGKVVLKISEAVNVTRTGWPWWIIVGPYMFLGILLRNQSVLFRIISAWVSKIWFTLDSAEKRIGLKTKRLGWLDPCAYLETSRTHFSLAVLVLVSSLKVSFSDRLFLMVARWLSVALDSHPPNLATLVGRKLSFPNRFREITEIRLYWPGSGHVFIPEPMTVAMKM